MGKIICDICGANYSETENQCPICGAAKSDSPLSYGETTAGGEDGYAYVKGGRFSKSNVKKRNDNRELPRTAPEKPKQETPKKEKAEKPAKEAKPTKEAKPAKQPKAAPAKKERTPKAAQQPAQAPEHQRRRRRTEDEPSGNNVGLIIIAIILVLAVVALCVVLVMEAIKQQNPGTTPSSTPSQQVDHTGTGGNTNGSQGPISIPCLDLRLPVPECTFTNVGDTLQIAPVVEPENTTEKVLYISSDERIATVDENGIVTAVADGEATIYVYCGSFMVNMKVICNVGVPPISTTNPTDPTEPTEPTEPPVILELNRSDFSLFGYRSYHVLYSGPLDRSEITWSSSDENVAIVENGKVIAVGNGMATITAEYEGQIAKCIVRCYDVVIASFTLSRTEFSITVGQSYTLKAYDADGIRIDPSELKFTTSAEGFFTVDENGKITGVKSNYNYKLQYVYVEYKGEVLKCVVRVNNPG